MHSQQQSGLQQLWCFFRLLEAHSAGDHACVCVVVACMEAAQLCSRMHTKVQDAIQHKSRDVIQATCSQSQQARQSCIQTLVEAHNVHTATAQEVHKLAPDSEASTRVKQSAHPGTAGAVAPTAGANVQESVRKGTIRVRAQTTTNKDSDLMKLLAAAIQKRMGVDFETGEAVPFVASAARATPPARPSPAHPSAVCTAQHWPSPSHMNVSSRGSVRINPDHIHITTQRQQSSHV